MSDLKEQQNKEEKNKPTTIVSNKQAQYIPQDEEMPPD